MNRCQSFTSCFLGSIFLTLSLWATHCQAQIIDIGGALGGVADTIGGALNDAATSIGDITKELEKLDPRQMGDCLNQIVDNARFGEVVKELAKTTPGDLGKALNGLDPSKVFEAFKAIDSDLSRITDSFQDNAKLGSVLNQLSPEKISQGLHGVGSRIAEVANSIPDNVKLGEALNKLSPSELRDCLAGLNRSIKDVALKVDTGKLASALDSLSPSKIADGLQGFGPTISTVANAMTNDSSLGQALNLLSDDNVRDCLGGLTRSISDVASVVETSKLGKALSQLSTTKLKEGLEGLGDRITEVAEQIPDVKNLGTAVNQLSIPSIAKVIDTLQIPKLKPLLAEISNSNIVSALNALVDSPTRVVAALSDVAKSRLTSILPGISPNVFNQALSDLLGSPDIAKLFQILGPDQLAALPWENLDKLKLPWEVIDPTTIPWDRIDPSTVRWEKIDPSKEVQQAGKWFEDKVSDAKNEAVKARDTIHNELDNAIASSTLVIQGLPSDVALVQSQIASKFEIGREFVEAQAEKLEQGIRSEIGRGIAALKETPWYQTIQNLLVQYTHVTAYDLTTDFNMTYNSVTGSYHLDMDFVPGVTLTSQDLQTLMAAELPMPNVDVIEVAATAASGVVLKKGPDEYESVRRTVYESHGKANVYFSSKRFVDWACAETVVNEGFKVIVTAGYGTEDALMEAEHQIVTELDDIYAWLKLRLERGEQAQLRSVLKGLIKCVITRRAPSDLGLSIPNLSVEFHRVPYPYEIQTVGVTKLYDDAIREVSNSIGIDWNKYRDALVERINKLDINSPHGAFAITISDQQNDQDYLDESLSRLSEFASDLDSQEEQYKLLIEALQEVIADEKLPSDLRDNLKKLSDYMDYGTFLQNNLQSNLQKRLQAILGFDPKSIEVDFKDGTPILDLMNTPLRAKLESALNALALGNEGSASVSSLEFNLSTYAFSAEARVNHKHTWRLDGLDEALGNGWTKLRGSVTSWISSKRRDLGSRASKSLSDMGALDLVSRNRPKQLSTNTTQQIAAIELQSQQESESGKIAIAAAQTRLTESPTSLMNPREYLMWHFLEVPEFIEINTSPNGTAYPGDHVYYVNGPFCSISDATLAGVDLANALNRPVRVLYNPSFINAERSSELPSLQVGETGTANVGDDLAECVYDQAWVELISAYIDVSSQADFASMLFSKAPVFVDQRLQKNRTVRQLAHLLYYNTKPLTIISHSQGSVQVRNALFEMKLLGGSVKNTLINWISCGSPLSGAEIGPRPKNDVQILHARDLTIEILKHKSSATPLFTNVYGNGMQNYVPFVRKFVDSPYSSLQNIDDLAHTSVTTSNGALLCFETLAGDFDNDGYDDVCAIRCVKSTQGLYKRDISVRLNVGNRPARGASNIQVQNLFQNRQGNLVCGDFDGDGYSDIALVSLDRMLDQFTKVSGGLYVMRNNQNGGFEELYFSTDTGFMDPKYQDYSQFLCGDFDGDGFSDLMQVNPRTKQWVIHYNLRNTRFGGHVDGQLPVSTCSHIVVGDFDGDKRDDLLTVNLQVTQTCSCTRCRGLQCRYCTCDNSEIMQFDSLKQQFVVSKWRFHRQLSFDLSGDWDGDGFTDLAAVNHYCEAVGATVINDRFRMQWKKNRGFDSTNEFLTFGDISTGFSDIDFVFNR